MAHFIFTLPHILTLSAPSHSFSSTKFDLHTLALVLVGQVYKFYHPSPMNTCS